MQSRLVHLFSLLLLFHFVSGHQLQSTSFVGISPANDATRSNDDADPCNFVTTQYYTPEDIQKCFDQFPADHNRTEYTNLLSLVSDYMQSYVFMEQYRSPPDPYKNLYQNLQTEFDTLSFEENETPYEFFMKISSLFRKLRDPHTLFVAPCLENFYFILPFGFTLQQDSTSDSGYIVKGIASHVRTITANWTSNSSNVDLRGRTIKYIQNETDGTYEDALTYISEWVSENGYISKSQHALFNRALRSEFHNRPAYLFKTPDPSTFNVTYLDDDNNEVNATLSWFGIVSSNMTTMDDYCPLASSLNSSSSSSTESSPNLLRIADLQKAVEARKTLIAKDASLQKKQEAALLLEKIQQEKFLKRIEPELSPSLATRAEADERYAELYGYIPGQTPSASTLTIDPEQLVTVVENDGCITVLCSPEEQLGYMRISSFSPGDYYLFAADVVRGLKELKETYNATKLVIDVRSNGGGYVMLGMQLHRLLFPSEYPTYGVYKQRKSLVNNEFAKVTDESETYVNPFTREVLNGTDWYTPNVTETYIDSNTSETVTYNYTQLFEMQMDPDVFTPFLSDWDNYPGYTGKAMFTPQNIVIVTDGLCGSTCCCFIKHVQETRTARIIGFGFDPHTGSDPDDEEHPYDSGSFCGGTISYYSSVTELKEFADFYTEVYGVNVSNLPDDFERLSTDLSYTQHAIYSWEKKSDTSSSSVSSSDTIISTGEDVLEFKVNAVHDINKEWFPNYLYDQTTQGVANIITQANNFFDQCYSFEVLDDELTCPGPSADNDTYGGEHKLYGHPCVNGTFNTTQCVFSRCADGYYLNGSYEDGALKSVSCVETPVTYVRLPHENETFTTRQELDSAGEHNYTSCVFVSQSSEDGGALYASSSVADITITSSLFSGCSGANGGAICYFGTGLLQISSTNFSSCSSTVSGGAIYFSGTETSSLVMSSCVFSLCTSSTETDACYGGAVYCGSGMMFSLTDSTFTSCSTESQAGTVGGGAVYSTSLSSTATGCTFTSCHCTSSSDSSGAGLYITSGTVSNCSFTLCNATSSGAQANGGGLLCISMSTVTDCSFDRCVANASTMANGGGIFGLMGVTVINSTFRDSVSIGYSGATCAGGVCALIMSNVISSSFTNCSTISIKAAASGGAVVCLVGSTISSCSFTGCMCESVEDGSTGGAILVMAMCSISDSSFNSCITKGVSASGGGVYGESDCNVTGCSFTQCSVSSSSSTAMGGAVLMTSLDTTSLLSNCTFTDCSISLEDTSVESTGNGGAVYWIVAVDSPQFDVESWASACVFENSTAPGHGKDVCLYSQHAPPSSSIFDNESYTLTNQSDRVGYGYITSSSSSSSSSSSNSLSHKSAAALSFAHLFPAHLRPAGAANSASQEGSTTTEVTFLTFDEWLPYRSAGSDSSTTEPSSQGGKSDDDDDDHSELYLNIMVGEAVILVLFIVALVFALIICIPEVRKRTKQQNGDAPTESTPLVN